LYTNNCIVYGVLLIVEIVFRNQRYVLIAMPV